MPNTDPKPGRPPAGFEWLESESREALEAIPSWMYRNRHTNHPPVEKFVKTERGWPTGIGRTTRRRHIAGGHAINIPMIHACGGGWHVGAAWFGGTPHWLLDTNYSITTKDVHRFAGEFWGIRDVRRPLREMGHPAGHRREPVWASTHDRAVLEIAWHLFGIRPYVERLDHHEVARWLHLPHHWLRLKWWIRRIERTLDGADREEWIKRHKGLSPWS